MKKLTILFLFVCTMSHAQNLILNGGFETATVGLPTGTPFPPYPTFLDEWSAVTTDGEFMYDATLAHTGTGFMSVLQNAGANPRTFWLGLPPDFGGYDRAVQIVAVDPSTSYNLKFWVRSGEGLRYAGYGDGNLLVQIEQFSPSANVIDSMSVFTPDTWQQAEMNFTTGTFCTEIAVLFSSYDFLAVDAWVDDIVLELATDVRETALVEVSVFPNPTTNELNLFTNTGEKYELIIYDSASRRVLEHTFTGSTTISMEKYPNGLYVYDLLLDDVLVKTGKVVVE
jgi:hypothetical protein